MRSSREGIQPWMLDSRKETIQTCFFQNYAILISDLKRKSCIQYGEEDNVGSTVQYLAAL
jgi:hypothetical protein